MRLVRFGGAMSLDGYIAGPNGEYDWIVMDPDIDFAEMQSQFDTFLIGRKTFEAMAKMGSDGEVVAGHPEHRAVAHVEAGDYPHVTVESDAERVVTELRAKPGKDIAIFGGGELFRSLLAAGLVDRIEVALIPVLLGGGIPLSATARRSGDAQAAQAARLREDRHRRARYDIVRNKARL